MVQAVSAANTSAQTAAAPDPGMLAARILAEHTRSGRRDLGEIKRELSALAAQDPALGAAVTRAVEARLGPVGAGELARATFAVTLADGSQVGVSATAMPVADKFRQPARSGERQLYDRLDRVWGDGDPRTNDTPAIEAGIRDMLARNLTLAQVEAARGPAPAPASGPSTATLVADLGQMALDLVGIIDPTGIADGSNAVISLGRAIGAAVSGEGGDALGHLGNGLLSAAGIIPLLGDAAKAGKIGKWAQTVADAVAAAAHNPAARAALEPALREIRDAVSRIPGGALDALPASARGSLERMRGQLDEFFGAGARVFNDAVTSTASRLGISPEKVQDIIDAGKGNRPDPSTYLPASRIAEHAQAFDGGASRFTLQGTVDKYGLGQRDGTTFVMTRAEADRILASTNGDPRKLEAALGLPPGQLDDGTLVRVDFSPDAMDDLNVRMPTGNEAGANNQWLPGGLLPSGANEAVLDGAKARPDHYRIGGVTLR